MDEQAPLPTVEVADSQPLITIVDDDPLISGLLVRVLGDDYRTNVCADARAGLASIRGERPVLVLLDVEMPGMDGFEMCQFLRSDPLTRDLPVIFLTGMEGDAAEERGFEVGGTDFIRKPIRRAVVRARVDRTVQLALYMEAMEAILTQDGDLASMRAMARSLVKARSDLFR